MSPILIIDICGTLYDSNTTFDFVKFKFGKTSQYMPIGLCRKSRVICRLNHYWFKLFGKDVLRSKLIKILKGYTSEEIGGMVSDFYDQYLIPRKNKESFDVIEKYRNNNARLILVSATLDVIAKEVAKREHILEWAASQLLYDEGKCLGTLGNDLLDGKLETTLSLTKGYAYDVITDNYGDSDIIKESAHAYLVQYKNRRDKWSHYVTKETLRKCDFIRL